MNDFQLKIPKPCPESWDGMTPDGNGRYCHSCNKVVVDFTTMFDVEIKNYFKQVSGIGTCGRFTYEQVEVERSRKVIFFKSVYDKLQITQIRPVRYVSVLMLGFVTMMFGCHSEKRPAASCATKDTTTTNVNNHRMGIDTLSNTAEDYMMGKVYRPKAK